MLTTEDVPLSQSALLVIDAQNSFKVGPRWARRNNHEFERNVSALIDAYRAAGLPVIYFLHTDADPGFEPDSVHLKLMDFLSPQVNEPVLLKDTRNAFTSTTLQTRLLTAGVRRCFGPTACTGRCGWYPVPTRSASRTGRRRFMLVWP